MRSAPRYEVGCAGQYIVGGLRYFDDLDEAIAAAIWPAGATVLDLETGSFEHTPVCMEEIEAAQARLEARSFPGTVTSSTTCAHPSSGASPTVDSDGNKP